MKKVKKLFIALLTSIVAFTFVVLPLNIAHASEVEVVNPLAKYEFLDASNPGKDSMGNYNLELKDADGIEAGTGVVSASEGVATFNGTAGLRSSSNDNDISEVLKSFTLAFDIKASTEHSSWAEPVSFGWNGWEPTKWGTFQFSSGSNLLRYSTGANIDGTTNAFWAHEIGNVKTDGFQSVLLIAEPGKKIEVYLDGALKYSYDLPQDFTFSDPNMRFALGGGSCWGNLYNPFKGQLKNVEIYDFAFNQLQRISYNVNGKLTSSDIAEQEIVDPLTKYEFKDAANPGKDSMGNYDLELKDADGIEAGTGVVSASEGVATFNGTAGLRSSSNDNDISEVLKSFTLAFDIKASTEHSSWAEPVSFGWNGWEPTKWGTFQFSSGSNLLRYSTGANIDGTTNAFWAHEIGNVKTDGFQSVLLVADPGKKIEVYLDGALKYSYDLPQDFTFSDPNMRFALGGGSCWGNLYNPFKGQLKNVEIYDFALNETQIAQYNETGKVYRAIDVIAIESVTDLSSVVRVPAGLSHEQILKLVPASSDVEVKMSNDSVKTANVTWSGVEEKDGSLYLTGEITGLVNPNGVKAYAKIAVVENAKVLLPIALYEFNDANNPGKDSMGNWDLAVVTKKDDKGNALDGNVRVENGVAYFDGSAGLLADSEENDISEALKSFTLTFEVLQTKASSDWSEPIGFGWDDWTPKAKWCTFELSGGSSDLRFTTASARDEASGKSNVDGNGNQWWGPVVGDIAIRQTVVLSVDLEGNITVYVDGVKKYSFATPAGYSLSDGNMRFAIGGNGVWGSFKNAFVGEISNVAIYDFAVNESQAKELCVTNELKAGITTTATYVADINTTPVFAGEATSAELVSTMSAEEMLAALNSANVKAMLSDESTLDLPAVWTEVVNEAGVYTAHGYAVCEGMLTTVNRVEVSYVLPVTDVLLSIEVATNPSKMTYVVGEELDLAGLVVNATMASGVQNQVTVTADMVSGFDSSKAGTTIVTISYEGKTATVELTVEEAPVEPAQKGCGGSVIASIFGVLALAGATIVLRKKREE